MTIKPITQEDITQFSSDVLDHLGAEHNYDKFIEEVGELLQALVKHKNKGTDKTYLNCIDELADVLICVKVFQEYFNQDKCDAQFDKKFRRARKRLDKTMNEQRKGK